MESYVIYTKSSLPQLSFPQPSEEFDKHTAQLHSIEFEGVGEEKLETGRMMVL